MIAIGRAILAVFLAFAIALGNPGQPAGELPLTILGAGYLLWSLALLVVTRSRIFIYGAQPLRAISPAIDFLAFTVLLYMSSGADSPFFTPFIFLILAATIQWGARGAMMMGVLTIIAYAPAAWSVFFAADHNAAAAQLFVLRLGYTVVVTIMLVAFARHLERVIEELSRLSDPVTPQALDAGPPVAEFLRHALKVFNASHGMFLWEEDDEPYASLAILKDGQFEVRRLAPGADDWVAPEAAASVFLFHSTTGATAMRSGGRSIQGPTSPLAPRLLAEVAFEHAIVAPAAGQGLAGWVFILDHSEPANEDLAIGAMVGAQTSVAIERWEGERTRQAAAAAEDRIRLSRDLHDGVLQFLAGARLQLDRLAAEALPDEAQARIATLRQAVTDEQNELRGFIATLRPASRTHGARVRGVADDLSQLAALLSRYWSVQVHARTEPGDLRIGEAMMYDLTRIVREGVANAVRHGGARCVLVQARAATGRLSLTIEDDGSGFAFTGAVPAGQLERTGEAPQSLNERVRALHGHLEVRSSPRGASVVIEIPLGAS